MSEATRPVGVEDLLAHGAFVRRVVATLLPGGPDVDDVVQETWVRALDRPPDRVESARPWLARVARNAALNVLRSRNRRSRRERAAARPEACPPEIDAVERLARHREVVDAVLALPEPLRALVTARYYEGRSLPEIAAADGTTVPTVRSRLRRAMALLRERLAARPGGDADAWIAAFAPLVAVRAARAGAWTQGGIVGMKSKAAAAALFALVLAGAAGTWFVARSVGDADGSAGGAAPEPRTASSRADVGTDVAQGSASAARSRPAADRVGSVGTAPAVVEKPSVPTPPPAETAASPGKSATSTPAKPPDDRPFVKAVKGRVLDVSTRTAIAGAHVFLVHFDHGALTGAWGAEADAEGGFEVGPSPNGRRADRVELRARAPGYRDGYASAEEGATIALERLDHPLVRGRVAGVLTDPDGHPAAGTVQIAGMDSVGEWFGQWTTAGADGAFVLEGVRPGPWRFMIESQCGLVDATVPEGGEARVQFKLKTSLAATPPGTTRDVRVAGLPDGGVFHLRLRSPGRHQFWRAVVRDGAAAFPVAPLGEWELVLERDDRDEPPRPLTIAAGEGALELDWARLASK